MDILGQVADDLDAEDPHAELVSGEIFKEQILVLALSIYHVDLTMVEEPLLQISDDILDHHLFKSQGGAHQLNYVFEGVPFVLGALELVEP